MRAISLWIVWARSVTRHASRAAELTTDPGRRWGRRRYRKDELTAILGQVILGVAVITLFDGEKFTIFHIFISL